MYSEERGIFKPSLKTHAMTNDVSIKRFSFTQHSQRQQNASFNSQQQRFNYDPFSYLSLDQDTLSFPKKFNNVSSMQQQQQIKYPSLFNQRESDLTATKFDPILPKIIFKRYISNQELPITQPKRQNSQIIQQLKVKNIKYPLQVQRLTKQAEQKKIQYFSTYQLDQNPPQIQTHSNNWRQNSYRQSLNQHINTGLKKMPYFPLMGTDGKVFWSHSADKVVFWKYRNSQIHNPDVFCILTFQQQSAPITAIYATHMISPSFKNQKIILIAIAFFNQLQFFSFNIEKYETQFSKIDSSNERNQDLYKKYVQKILVKVNSNFFIQKILIQNVQNFEGPNYQTHPLVLFTDGSRDLQIVDLSNLSAFKSHNQYNPLLRRQKNKQNKNQNQIIKLLHCRDEIRPQIHYAFVLRKQTLMNQIKPKTLLQKIKNFFTFTKNYRKSQQMILSMYQWNQKELKNQTLWKKLWNPPRVKKIKDISSKDLQIRLKQNFFEFFRLNSNSQFFIADISLVQKPKTSSILQNQQRSNCFLKVTFINGTSVMISNFKTLTFVSKVAVNPYIQSCVPIVSCQYQNYRNILQKGHYLQTHQQIKNKFNLYIYESVDIEKQARYSSIDPVISESNGLMICEDKLIYRDEQQITYKFHDCNSRKRINEVELQKMGQKKSFMIFEDSFITFVQTPNMAQNLLVLGYLQDRRPEGKEKIGNYVKSLIEDMSENNRVSFLKSIIQLLILIHNSGKQLRSNSPNRMILEDIVRDFYGREKRLDVDDTTYVEEKDNYKPSTEQVYGYDCEIGKQSYQNFVEYLLGSQIANKEKQFLKEKNSSYNGKSFQLKITQNTVNFLMDILIEQALILIPSKPVLKPAKTTSIDSFCETFNINEETYLKNLVQGMSQVNESYLGGAISKFIVDLIRPLITLSYESFHHIKSSTTKILQILDLLQQFLDQMVRFSSFKNYQSIPFSQTVLLMKSLQNSLPKFSLLLRLFDALSEINFYNGGSQNTQHKSKSSKNDLSLVNFLFRLNPKEMLSQMAVEMLFDENGVFLDEIESKLPQLNEVKYLRYWRGWKIINSNLLQRANTINDNKNKSVNSSWIFNFFNSNNQEKGSKIMSPLIPFQNEQHNFQEVINRQKQEFLQIQKALNEQSFEDFQKYFLNTNQYLNFVHIILSKIHYLQTNYLQLKNKYNFQDGIYDTFQSFTSNLIQKSVNSILNPANKLPQNIQKPQLSSFLRYEQKIHNHQKYLKTYQLIKFMNSKLSLFIDKVFQIYTQQTQKSEKQLLSSTNQNNIKSPSFHQPNLYNLSEYTYLLGQQVQKLVDLLMQKGSQFIKYQLENKIKICPKFQIFLIKYKQQSNNQLKISKQFVDFYEDKNFLVKDQPMPLTLQQKQKLLFENQRKNMYIQKIEQKITFESRQPFKIQNDINWMKKHNENSSLNFTNQQF